MSNYIKSTDFAAKDGLLTGNPLKIVSGTELNDEFNALQVAVNTKANSNSPSLTGVPLSPTASAGTNTTQIASTAFVTGSLSDFQTVVDAAILAARENAYPVGSIYTNASVSTNPSTLLGFGSWSLFGAGKVLVGIDTGDSSFNTLGETGGSKNAINVAHSHSGSAASNGAHTHSTRRRSNASGSCNDALEGANSTLVTNDCNTDAVRSAGAHTHTVTVNSAGSSGTNANLQPYITVYTWKRTA